MKDFLIEIVILFLFLIGFAITEGTPSDLAKNLIAWEGFIEDQLR